MDPGESPRSAVESTSATTSSGTLPGERDDVRDVESLGQLDELVGAVPLSHEDELDVVTAGTCELGGGAECEIDTVLRAHHTEVGAEVRRPRRQSGFGSPRRRRSGSGPVRTTVTSLRRARSLSRSRWLDTSRSSRSRDRQRRTWPARGGGGRGAGRASRSGIATRTPRGRGRAGRRRTSCRRA